MRNDCQIAEQTLTTAHPAPKLQWASWAIRRCAAAAPVVAEAALRLRTSRDTALLKVVTAPAAVVRDRRLYSAALTIVTDPTASPEARVFAMRMLAWLFYPNADLNFGDFVDLDGDGDRSCFGGGPPMDFAGPGRAIAIGMAGSNQASCPRCAQGFE